MSIIRNKIDQKRCDVCHDYRNCMFTFYEEKFFFFYRRYNDRTDLFCLCEQCSDLAERSYQYENYIKVTRERLCLLETIE